MATFLIATLSNSGLQFRPAIAADLATLEVTIETALRGALRTGLPLYNGQPALDPVSTQVPSLIGASINDGELLVGILQFEAGARISPGVNPANPVSSWNNRMQPSIADLPAFTVTTVAQANTAVQAIRTSYNTLLAELRAVGILSP